MIAECPGCGTKNRIPDTGEENKVYLCSKCKTRLTTKPEYHISNSHKTNLQEVDDATQGKRLLPRKLSFLAAPFLPVFNFFRDREWLVVCLLLLTVLSFHLFILPLWESPYCDEEYYVPEARSIIYEGESIHPEHPPLGKLFIALGIRVIGDNPWGWRIPAVIFGVASVAVFYFISRKLAGRSIALLASILFIFETLFFIHSSVAMLDVFSLTFMLAAFLLYLHGKYPLSGMSLALSGLCKMTGLFGLLPIIVHFLIFRRKVVPIRNIALFLVSTFATLIVIMPIVDFAADGQWLNPITRIWDMGVTHSALTVSGSTAEQLEDISYPWEWILSPIGHMDLSPGGTIAIISPTIWIFIIPAMIYVLLDYMNRRTEISFFILLWFGATYLLWLPIVIATDRISYLFYFYPTVGAICLAIAYIIRRIWDGTSKKRYSKYRLPFAVLVTGYFGLHIILFLFLAPIIKALDHYIHFLPPVD
jgi:predicted membrane-bound dolichyl-phosphate-mannose-protein mannosyltransferase